ncbi:MAG: ParB/RepB/Spo0J family partition protein [Candidatus Methylomirabilis oxygeniifera]|uniref:Chromosome partitioning protein n=1 Tax=Methylomirabilis oxygeniifera TaxID=671143 RepID=D5MLX1_METO1|nr:MAG: ParB/RepB/Spo0J family partition protein [Candidatus Methylomirabilis oxyfera]CBE70028.1 chromosome partitioning protein [Candidatus Methylomirabilis oxyfera]
MAQRRALGRGLETLIPAGDPSGVLQIRVEEIALGSSQPRRSMNDSKLNELASSIKAHGVLLPILLRREGGRLEVVAGERRLRAARMAGLDTVPALVKELSSSQALEVALIENLQREDLNPIEQAEAYLRLQDEFGLTQEEVARRVGRDRSSVANALRLLKLPKPIQADLVEGVLSEGHARALLGLDRTVDQIKVRDEAIRRGLSVRTTEVLVRRLKQTDSAPQRRQTASEPAILAAEDALRQALGTKVQICRKGKGGTIEVEFYSTGDLDRIYERICRHD